MRSFTDAHEALAAEGVAHEIIHLPSSSRTAQLAANALGVPVTDVVKSLVSSSPHAPYWPSSPATRPWTLTRLRASWAQAR